MTRYMVVSRVSKGKKYAGSWHGSKKSANAFANHLRSKGARVVVTKRPKARYKF